VTALRTGCCQDDITIMAVLCILWNAGCAFADFTLSVTVALVGLPGLA